MPGPGEARSTLRFPRAVLERLDAPTLERLADDLREYVGLGGPSLAASGSPWAIAKVTTPEGAERARQWAEHVMPVTADLQSRRRLGLTATLIREDGREGDVFSLIGRASCRERV